jgi:hypothetical protein
VRELQRQAEQREPSSVFDYFVGADGGVGELRGRAPSGSAELPASASSADAQAGSTATQASASVDRDGTFVANPQLRLPQQAQQVLGDGNGSIRASEPVGDEIVCQGIETVAIAHYAWTPDESEVSLMYFSPARAPAGADGGGLEPGRCGYVNAAWPDDRAGVLLFTTAPGEDSANTIREFLRNPAHYWSFVVSENAAGFYEATRHARWTPAADTGAEPQ